MGSIRNTVYYCCVWNGDKVLYAYNNNNNGNGDQEIEKLAALCLEKAPNYHKWYFQTMFNKSFGFLMDGGFVYFAIFDESVGSPRNLAFLERVRDAFKKAAKKGSKRILSNPNSPALQEQLLPVIKVLIASLEKDAATDYNDGLGLSPSPNGNDGNGQVDGASTKAPLLGKASKQDKRKTRDHVISVRENGVIEEHRKSDDKPGSKVDSSTRDLMGQDGSVVGMSLTKEVSSMSRSGAQTVRNKWCRQVRIVLAIDVVICLTLFIVWLVVCRGTSCIR